MEIEIHLGEQVARIDREATAALYSDLIKIGDADECSCTSCRNFAAQRATAFPEEFLSLIKQLGADPLKELEAFDLDFGLENAKSHQYGGWFALGGKIIKGADWRPNGQDRSFNYWFTDNFPNASLPKDVCAIEFLCELPWIIPEPPERPNR